MENKKELVFVYGTLKFGFSNSGFLLDSEIIGRAETKRRYSLYEWDLPYLIKEPNHKVKGEVYKINKQTLSYLDSLEGHPYLYERQKIKVTLNGKKKDVNCWGYFWQPPKRTHWKLTNGEYKQNKNNELWD
jgi:gamma-glutamylcyclotransferase (GGCT)/AIG2-like uncharacterized protein YtfP